MWVSGTQKIILYVSGIYKQTYAKGYVQGVCVCIRRRNKCKVALNSVNMFAMFCVCVIYIYTQWVSLYCKFLQSECSVFLFRTIRVQRPWDEMSPQTSSNMEEVWRSMISLSVHYVKWGQQRTFTHEFIHLKQRTQYASLLLSFIYICICIYIYMLLILVYLLDWLDAMIPNSEYSWVDIASALLPFENPAWD